MLTQKIMFGKFGQNKVSSSDARGRHRHADIFRNFFSVLEAPTWIFPMNPQNLF